MGGGRSFHEVRWVSRSTPALKRVERLNGLWVRCKMTTFWISGIGPRKSEISIVGGECSSFVVVPSAKNDQKDISLTFLHKIGGISATMPGSSVPTKQSLLASLQFSNSREEEGISPRVRPDFALIFLPRIVFLPDARGEDMLVPLIPPPIHHFGKARVVIHTF